MHLLAAAPSGLHCDVLPFPLASPPGVYFEPAFWDERLHLVDSGLVFL